MSPKQPEAPGGPSATFRLDREAGATILRKEPLETVPEPGQDRVWWFANPVKELRRRGAISGPRGLELRCGLQMTPANEMRLFVEISPGFGGSGQSAAVTVEELFEGSPSSDQDRFLDAVERAVTLASKLAEESWVPASQLARLAYRPPLFLNHIAGLDWLIALEFGRVDDGQPPANWRGATDDLGFLYEEPEGTCLGFKVLEFSTFDPAADAVAEIWAGPRFHAPQLGLRDVTAGEVITAAQGFFAGTSSLNRAYFDAACVAEGDEELSLWNSCLHSGDAMAHFGLGCALLEAGEHARAYRHLRYYTEIAPNGAWNWCWFGKAARAIGETGEAARAFRRAIQISKSDGEETDAEELLAELGETRGLQ